MPNPKIEKDDFNIKYTPDEIKEREKKAEEAKKAAEENMRKQLTAFKQNREKWRTERLVDLKTAKKALQDEFSRLCGMQAECLSKIRADVRARSSSGFLHDTSRRHF